MGKVDENKKKKKEALFNTAYELFTTKGINATAISDIVEKAGVAKGTFYLYFKDKYDIKNKLTAFNFISKNLVMGALRSALLTEERTEPDFYEEFLNLVNEDSYKYECPDVMLFTIVELTGSTAYNSILYNEPLSIEEYKPYLYRTVRLIIASHRQ